MPSNELRDFASIQVIYLLKVAHLAKIVQQAPVKMFAVNDFKCKNDALNIFHD